MRNFIRFHVTRHDRLVVEGGSPFQQRSRQQAWCQNTQVRLDLSQELREVFLVCRVRLRPDLLGFAVVEVDLPLLGGLDHTDRCDGSAGFFLGNLWSLVSLDSQLLEAPSCASWIKAPCLALPIRHFCVSQTGINSSSSQTLARTSSFSFL